MQSTRSFSMRYRRVLLSPLPASPVKSDEPLCTLAEREPCGCISTGFILSSSSSMKSICPSLVLGVTSTISSSPSKLVRRNSYLLSFNSLPSWVYFLSSFQDLPYGGFVIKNPKCCPAKRSSRIVLPFFIPSARIFLMIRSDLQMAYVSGFISVPDTCIALSFTPMSIRYSLDIVNIPPLPAASSCIVIIFGRLPSNGLNTIRHSNCITSLGVKCSPASSLFSSLNRRRSSSKRVPIS